MAVGPSGSRSNWNEMAFANSRNLQSPPSDLSQTNVSLWDFRIDALFHDLNETFNLSTSSTQPTPAAPTTWSELVSEAVTTVETPTPTELQQCEICLEEIPVAEFPNRRITTACNHKPSSCLPCLRKSIKTDHENKIWNDIFCPECPSRLSDRDVQDFADPETFTHYEFLSSRAAISALPLFVWCLECPSGQLHEDGDDQPIVRCQNCHATSCFTHRISWHEGMTCGQYNMIADGVHSSELAREGRTPPDVISTQQTMDEAHKEAESNNWRTRFLRLIQIPPLPWFSPQTSDLLRLSNFSKSPSNLNSTASEVHTEAETKHLREAAAQQKKIRDDILKKQRQEEASLKTIKQHCKICPGEGCNWPIEKKDGCAHMTCIKCKQQFCWKCRMAWAYGHKCWGL